MLRQSKPLPRSPGTSTAPLSHSFLLSLDWNGGGDRYPVPGGVRRPATPLDDMFLMASLRDPMTRPTHETSSSETVTSAASYDSSHASGPNSPTRSPRETVVGAAWDNRSARGRETSPLGMTTIVPDVGGYESAMMSSPIEIDENYANGQVLHDDEPHRLEPHPHIEHHRCPTGQHTTGLRGSIRKKLGRNVICSRCGEVYEANHLGRRSSKIGRSLRGSLRRDSDDKDEA